MYWYAWQPVTNKELLSRQWCHEHLRVVLRILPTKLDPRRHGNFPRFHRPCCSEPALVIWRWSRTAVCAQETASHSSHLRGDLRCVPLRIRWRQARYETHWLPSQLRLLLVRYLLLKLVNGELKIIERMPLYVCWSGEFYVEKTICVTKGGEGMLLQFYSWWVSNSTAHSVGNVSATVETNSRLKGFDKQYCRDRCDDRCTKYNCINSNASR